MEPFSMKDIVKAGIEALFGQALGRPLEDHKAMIRKMAKESHRFRFDCTLPFTLPASNGTGRYEIRLSERPNGDGSLSETLSLERLEEDGTRTECGNGDMDGIAETIMSYCTH